jgi:hypothetical protein
MELGRIGHRGRKCSRADQHKQMIGPIDAPHPAYRFNQVLKSEPEISSFIESKIENKILRLLLVKQIKHGPGGFTQVFIGLK